MKPKDLTGYSLKNISKKLNSINIQINLSNQRPFPKPKERMLSYYTDQNRLSQKYLIRGILIKPGLLVLSLTFPLSAP